MLPSTTGYSLRLLTNVCFIYILVRKPAEKKPISQKQNRTEKAIFSETPKSVFLSIHPQTLLWTVLWHLLSLITDLYPFNFHLVFLTGEITPTMIAKYDVGNGNDEYFCYRQHLLCAQLQEFDNAAHISFIGTVYYSVFIPLERSTVRIKQSSNTVRRSRMCLCEILILDWSLSWQYWQTYCRRKRIDEDR